MCVCVCVCVCVMSLHTAKGVMLKSEDFQPTDFFKTASFKRRMLFAHLRLVGFYLVYT